MGKNSEKSFQVARYLPTRLINNINNLALPEKVTGEMCYVVCYVIFRALSISGSEETGEGEYSDYVEISRTMFVNALGDRKIDKKSLYVIILDILEEAKIISAIKNGYSGERCNSYKINDDQYCGNLTKLILSDEYLKKQAKKIIDSSKSDNDKRKVKMTYSTESANWIRSMKYDGAAALDYLNRLYVTKTEYKGKILTEKTKSFLELKIQVLELGNTEQKYRDIAISQTNGRVTTDISDLRKDFRQFIKGDDLLILDITNSQPVLLNVLIDFILDPASYPTLEKYLGFIFDRSLSYKKKTKVTKDTYLNALKGVQVNLHEQFKIYRKVTESGKFYEYLQEWFWRNNYKKYEENEYWIRDNMKKTAFQMFYMDWSSKELAASFPYVNKFIDTVKKVFIDISNDLRNSTKKARLFAVTMQAIESLLWIQTIQTLLNEKKIKYYGIHDSVIIESKDKDEVLSIIRKVYGDYQLNPDIDIKPNNFNLFTAVAKKKEVKRPQMGIEGLFETKK